LRILKKEWADLYGKEDGKWELADEGWQKRVCRAILGKPDDYGKLPSPPFAQNMRMDPKQALLAVSAGKNQGQTCDMAETTLARLYPDWEPPAVASVARFWRCYEQAKEKRYDLLSKVPARRLDFDDLLVETFHLLRDDDAIRGRYQTMFDYFLVDETQDTSTVQWELARLLAERSGNLFLVGDVGQSVYGFSGLRPAHHRDVVPKGVPARPDHPAAGQLSFAGHGRHGRERTDRPRGLDDRYRLFMETTRPPGLDPGLHQHVDAEAEAQGVVERLRAFLNEGQTQFKDFAILYRTNAYSRAFEDA
jgi:superfamily I DNA/RNA helicase